MFGVSPAELVTIAVIALVVLGPRRLPEASRRAGRALRELRDTAEAWRQGLEAEMGEMGETDLGEVRRALPPTAEPPPDGGGG